MKNQDNGKKTSIPETPFNPSFEEFTSDGRTYYDFATLKYFNIKLMCESKSGIVLAGSKGIGKTTFMRRFVQQDLSKELGIESLKVLYIFDDVISKLKSDEYAVKALSKICQKYSNSGVIFFFKANNEDTLQVAINVFDKYAKRIKEQCGNTCVKLIVEYTLVEDKKERARFSELDLKSFWKYYLPSADEFDKRIKVYNLMAKELSCIYNVKISSSMTFLASTIVLGNVKKEDNLQEFYNYFETLFVQAKIEKKTRISKSFIKKAYKEKFQIIATRGEAEVRRTAFHESGHTTLMMLDSRFKKVDYVTIIPGLKYSGATMFSKKEDASKHLRDRQAVIHEIAECIAGREAERLVIYPFDPNKGAFSDLRDVKIRTDELIHEFGISSSIGNNIVIPKDEFISENMKAHIEAERRKIVDEATKVAFDAVFKHKAFIEKLAKRLLAELCVPGKEVYKMWKEHLKELDEK